MVEDRLIKINSGLTKLTLILGLLFLVSVIFSGAVSAAGLASTPQPKFHHDLNNTGQSQYNGPQTSKSKWTYRTGGFIINSPSIGTDGNIYFGSSDGYLYALDSNGTQRWKFHTDGMVRSSPAIDTDGTLYFGSADTYLYALNPNGTLKWNFKTGGGIYAPPAIGTDGTIYVGSYDNLFYAIHPDGTQYWTFTMKDGTYSCPAIGTDGTIYVGSMDGDLYSLNPDGTKRWNFTTGAGLFSSPAVGKDGTIYIGSQDGNLYAINSSGGLKWKFNTGLLFDAPAIGKDGTIYIGSYNHNFYAVNPNGTMKWKYQTGEMIQSSAAIGADGTIYFGSADSYIYALNSNGTLKWKYLTGSTVGDPTIGRDGTLYVGTFDYNMYAIQDTLTVSSTHSSGTYNNSLKVVLKLNRLGSIYYTINGTTPTSNSIKYTGPISITKNTILKYFAVDVSGVKTGVYTRNYTIDRVAPTISSTVPGNMVLGVSKTGTITVKFSENIKYSTDYSKITIKNLSTGKTTSYTRSISGKTLYLKNTSSRSASTWYQVTIPAKAVKDYAGNDLKATYTFKFKTGA